MQRFPILRGWKEIVNVIQRRKIEVIKGVGLILFIDLVLILIWFSLPNSLAQNLALNKYAPTLLTFYTNHFIHGSTDHLFWNVVWFTTVSFLLFLILFLIGRQKTFYKLCIIALTILPFVLSGIWIIMVNQIKSGYYTKIETTRGFSGIVSSFIGFLIYAYLFEYLTAIGIRASPFLSFLSLTLLFALLFVGTYLPYHHDFLLFFSVLASFSISYFFFLQKIEIKNKKLNRPLIILEVSLPFLLVALFSMVMFPFRPRNTDIIGHYIGVIIGLSVYMSLKQLKVI